MRRVFVHSAALLAIVAAMPAAAAAQDNSAIDQYTEGVPGAGGDEHGDGGPGGSGRDDHGSSAATLPAAESQQLQSEGADGAAAAGLAEATAPARPHGASAADPNGTASADGNGSGSRAESGGGPSVGDVVSGVADRSESGGLGIWLPIILGATLLAAIAVGVARWRRGSAEPTHA